MGNSYIIMDGVMVVNGSSIDLSKLKGNVFGAENACFIMRKGKVAMVVTGTDASKRANDLVTWLNHNEKTNVNPLYCVEALEANIRRDSTYSLSGEQLR